MTGQAKDQIQEKREEEVYFTNFDIALNWGVPHTFSNSNKIDSAVDISAS